MSDVEKFVNAIRPMLANPNGIAAEANTIYLFTKDSKLVSCRIGETLYSEA